MENNAAIAVPDYNTSGNVILTKQPMQSVTQHKVVPVMLDGVLIQKYAYYLKHNEYKVIHNRNALYFECTRSAEQELSEYVLETKQRKENVLRSVARQTAHNIEYRLDNCKDADLEQALHLNISSVGTKVLMGARSFAAWDAWFTKCAIISRETSKVMEDIQLGIGAFSTVTKLLGTDKVIKYWQSNRDTENFRYIRDCMQNKTHSWQPKVYATGKIKVSNADGSIVEVFGFSVMDTLTPIDHDDESALVYALAHEFELVMDGIYNAHLDIHTGNVMKDQYDNYYVTDPFADDNKITPLLW